jgi:hypothetical protein
MKPTRFELRLKTPEQGRELSRGKFRGPILQRHDAQRTGQALLMVDDTWWKCKLAATETLEVSLTVFRQVLFNQKIDELREMQKRL